MPFRFSGERPGPRASIAGHVSRPDGLLRRLGVQDRCHVPTTVVSTALAVVPCIRRPLTSLLGRPSRIAPCMRSARRSGAPTVAGAGQSGPGCCTAVIYLHTAVHTLWLTSPGVNRCLRSLSCVHRRTDARPTPAGKPRHADGHTAVGAKSCGPVSGHAHVGPRHAAGLPGSLRNLRPRKQHSGLGPGPARGRPACPGEARPAPAARRSDARTGCQPAVAGYG